MATAGRGTGRYWALVFAGGLIETVWVVGLKAATTPLGWALTIGAIAVNFALLMRAIRFLPVGSVYAVFCGLGAAASVIAETVWFGEPVQPAKIALIALLIVGVAGLKLVTPLAPAPDVEKTP